MIWLNGVVLIGDGWMGAVIVEVVLDVVIEVLLILL